MLRAMAVRAMESNLHCRLQGACGLGRELDCQPISHIGITKFEKCIMNRVTIRLDATLS